MSRRVEGVFVAFRSLGRYVVLAAGFAFGIPFPALAEVFDIQRQSLSTAIDAFCAATGAEVYYDGEAALGQQSARLAGDHRRDDALRILLGGTELVPLRIRSNSYLLINPGADAARQLAAAKSAQDAHYRQYFAVVQHSVLRRLCHYSAGTMTSERLVIRLWIDPAGTVQRLDAAETGQSESRILDLYNSLRGLRLPEAPPSHMPQPVTIALLPGKSAVASYCPPMATPNGH